MQNIFIGIPSYDNNIPILMNELLNNIKNRSQYKDYVKIVFKIGMPVHKARNFLVNDFIQDQSCGYLLMIDADNPISVE